MPKITIPSIDTLAQQAVDILLQSSNHEPLLENIIAPISFMPDSTDAKQRLMKGQYFLSYRSRLLMARIACVYVGKR